LYSHFLDFIMLFPSHRTFLSLGAALLLLGMAAPVMSSPPLDSLNVSNVGTDTRAWLQDFKEHMRRTWDPLITERERHFPKPLRATLTLKINSDGSLKTVVVAKSSNQAFFDEKCMNAVRSAAPFPRFPKSLKADPVTVNFSFWVVPEEESAKNKRKGDTGPEWGELIVNVCHDPLKTLVRAEQLLREDSSNLEIQDNYITILLRSGRTEGFEELLNQVDRQFGNSREIGMLRAVWLYRERRFDEAQQVLISIGEPKTESDWLLSGTNYQQLLGNLEYAAGNPGAAAYHWGRAIELCGNGDTCRNLQTLAKAAEEEQGVPPEGADQRILPACDSNEYGYPAGGRMQALYKRLSLPLK
jgi:TonB family protein